MKDDLNISRQIFQMLKSGIEAITKALSSTHAVQLKGAELVTIKGEKGDKGDSPSKDELVKIIKPLIPDPIKGEPGADGDDYMLTADDKKEIASKIKVPVVEKVIEKTEVIREKPMVTQMVKEVAVKDTPEELVKKLQKVKKQWLSIEAIEGDFNSKVSRPASVPGSRPLDVLINGVSQGIAREINFVGNAISSEVINGVLTVIVSDSGGGGKGYTVETPSGALYDQDAGTGGTDFTVTVKPVYIVADGTTYFEGAGYTLSGLNVSMTNPVTGYIRSFHE